MENLNSRSDFIAELAEHSPIIIQNSSNPSSRKNLDVRPYDRTTVQGATFNMRGQLYRGHVRTALSSSPVVSALGSESDDPGSSPGRGKALCPWDVQEKKMRAPLLGLAKSIYYSLEMSLFLKLWNIFFCFFVGADEGFLCICRDFLSTLYTLTSVCIFSIPFAIHLLWN